MMNPLRLLAFVILLGALLVACGRLALPASPTNAPLSQAALEPGAQATAQGNWQSYSNVEAGFSLELPAGWTINGPQKSSLGSVYLLGPTPLAESGPANSTLIVADTRNIYLELAIEQLCGGACSPIPEATELTLNGSRAWLATIGGEGSPALDWYFVDNGDKFIFFSIHDPVTLKRADQIIRTMTFTPVVDRAAHAEEAGQVAGTVLRQQLQLDFEQVTVVSVDRAEWSDSCLGLPREGEVCAQVITPGYKVVLEAGGERYEYHLDQQLSDLRLAAGPPANPGEAAITWQSPVGTGGCKTATVGSRGVAFGPCGGVLMLGQLVAEERAADLAYFVETYAPFKAETRAGKVTFNGQGTTVATGAEQRQIAEWARLVSLEAEFGRSGAGWDFAFSWHREGGLAGFCDEVRISVIGRADLVSCGGEQIEHLVSRRLEPEQLQQVYAWLDTLQGFQFERTDPATADALTVRLDFAGAGPTEATDADKEAIEDFAESLWETFAAGTSFATDWTTLTQ